MNDQGNILQSKRMGNVLLLLGLIGILYVAALAVNEMKKSPYVGRDVASQNTISVSGSGEAFAKPDTATFNFTIEESAKVVADAQRAVDDKVKKALDFLKGKGVDEKDIKTVSYQIYPKYEYAAPVVCTSYGCPPQREPNIIGYTVSQTFEVKVRKIDAAGDLLSGIGSVGVNNVSGLTFTVDKEDALQAEARAEAIMKAKEKANQLANQLGVSIVRVVNFSESGSYPPIYFSKSGMGGAMADSAPAPVSVSPGETRIVSNVTITYEIR